jgi:hypothetical protein
MQTNALQPVAATCRAAGSIGCDISATIRAGWKAILGLTSDVR